MLKRDSLMNLVVALNAVLLENNKLEETVDILLAHNAKCSLLSVLLVEKKLQYLSNLPVTSQYIAATVTNHVHAAIGKILNKAFLGPIPRKAFLFYLTGKAQGSMALYPRQLVDN